MYTALTHRLFQSVAIAAIGVLLVMGPVGSGLPNAPSSPATHLLTLLRSSGAVQLSQARTSLAHGEGPAARAITPFGPAGARGSLTSLTGPPTSYYWNNLTAYATGEPSLRTAPTMTYDASDGYVVLYGGANASALDDTWTYANGTWTNVTATTTGSPPALYIASMAYDPSSSSVILFGGENLTGVPQSQTWSYHNLQWTNLTTTAGTPPSPRIFGGMATDTATNEVVLAGGDEGGTTQSAPDTWIFKDGSWTNVTLAAPIHQGLILPTLADDPAAGGVLLTAAASNVTGVAPFFGATYLYKGGVWENLTTWGPHAAPLSVSEASAMGYLASASGVFLGLGLNFNQSGSQFTYFSTWEYTSAGWTNLTGRVSDGPQGSDFYASAVLPGGSALLLYGCVFITGNYPATWALAPPPTVTASSSSSSTDVGATVTFTGSASGGVDPIHGAWTFGDGGTATTFAASHAYSGPGTYSAQFTATDLIGENASATAAVVVNPLPSVTASVTPSSSSTGSGVAFVATVTGGTAPYSFSWAFGDGGTGSGAGAGHTYTSAGAYTATVKVTDAVGKTANGTVTVTVASAPGNSTGFSYTSGTGLDLVLLIVVLVIVAVILAALLARKGGGSRGPPTQYAGATSVPPRGPAVLRPRAQRVRPLRPEGRARGVPHRRTSGLTVERLGPTR